MIDTRRSTTPGIWEPADTQSLSERLRAAELSGPDRPLLTEAADALDAKDEEIKRLQEIIVNTGRIA